MGVGCRRALCVSALKPKSNSIMTYLNQLRKLAFLLTVVGLVFTLSSCEEEILEECQEVSISASLTATGTYLISLDSDSLFTSVEWSIDNATLEDISDASFEYQLAAGTYELCVSATSIDCGDLVDGCLSLTVAESSDEGGNEEEGDGEEEEDENEEATECPEAIEFEFAASDNGTYVFELVNENASAVEWLVDGQVVGEGNRLEKSLGSGEFSVCVIANFEGCDVTLEYCEDITIEGACPDVRFGTNIDESTGTYEFTLGTTDALTSVYWKINGDIVGQEATLEKVLDAGTNEVCVVASYEECPNGVVYCETIVVEEQGTEAGCPDMFFAYEQDDEVENKYLFYADFEGIENLEWYGWYVDDAELESEGTLNEGDNYFEFTFNEVGTHEVCILTETPDCPAGAAYCVEIVIE